MPDEVCGLLRSLGGERDTHVVLVSGRPRQFLDRHLRELPVDVAGEHGFIFRRKGAAVWDIFVDAEPLAALPKMREKLQSYADRVPRSFIEEKEFSFVWHHRAAAPEFSEIISSYDEALSASIPAGLRLLRGNCTSEIRLEAGGKGSFVEWYLRCFFEVKVPEVLLAIGYDTTDEEMFPVVNACSGFSIRVGPGETAAKFRLERPQDVWTFLRLFAEFRALR
jgi:trehalose 6-phosphate synthase/phosphatase